MSSATRAFMAPRHYWQGPGELDRLGERLAHLGRTGLVVLSKRSRESLGGRIVRGGAPLVLELMSVPSACSFPTVDAVEKELRSTGVDLVIAVGGGTIIDTVKAAASRVGTRVAVVPSLASTDAPTAAAAVIYTEDGSAVASIETYPDGPDAVLVDTDLIRRAPSRYLIAGMGDALATAYEARAAATAGVAVLAGGTSTNAARAIAEQCRTVLFDRAAGAIAYLEGTAEDREPFEAVVETNILLSGLGFESGGLAGAHAIHNGLKPFASHGALHGELVGYGILVHLVLLGEMDEARAAHRFLASVGLPVTAAQVGVDAHDPAVIHAVAVRACDPGDSMGNMPIAVAPEDVERAVRIVESELSA